MRLAVLLIVALVEPALAKPEPLPPVRADLRRPFETPLIVLAPSTPLRPQPVADAAQRSVLAHRIATKSGVVRIAALDALASTLEALAVEDPDFDVAMNAVVRHYTALLTDPALAGYAHAAEVLVRGAKAVALRNERLALQAAERVLDDHPGSPFTLDAHLLLAKLLDDRQHYKAALQHVDSVIASKRPPFVQYARLQRGWLLGLAGDARGAITTLTSLATDPAAQLLHEPAIETIIKPYAKAGRVDLAIALFDRVDRSKSPRWLRRLATEYMTLGKQREAITTLRAALAREGDPTLQCFDRADIVTAMTDAPNRADAELAVAELVANIAAGDARCATAADHAVGELAFAWHAAWKPKDKRARLVRIWNHAIELATTKRRKAAAMANRDALSPRARAE